MSADRPLTLEQWRAEGASRFGTDDARRWRFVCPSCGHVQTYNELKDMGVPHPDRYFAFACIGLFHLNNPAAADNVVEAGRPTQGWGCAYRADGDIAPVLLEVEPGKIRRTFEFAP